MANDDETLAIPKPRFDSTQWSLVMAAKQRSTPDGAAAFKTLCEKYWFPLYAFVRQIEKDCHRAQDLTQSFFAKAMEKNYVGDADPKRGRFRTFLLASISNFIANEWNNEQAQQRVLQRRIVALECVCRVHGIDAASEQRPQPSQGIPADTCRERQEQQRPAQHTEPSGNNPMLQKSRDKQDHDQAGNEHEQVSRQIDPPQMAARPLDLLVDVTIVFDQLSRPTRRSGRSVRK